MAPAVRRSGRTPAPTPARELAAQSAKVTKPKTAKKAAPKKAAAGTQANTAAKRTAAKAAVNPKAASEAPKKRGRPKAADAEAPTKTTTKRKQEDDSDAAPATKRTKKAEEKTDAKPKAAAKPKAVAKPKPTPKPKAAPKPKPVVNGPRFTQKLNVYVFGEGSNAELGLGTAKNCVDVKRPRLNPFLPVDTVGVVRVATGGMHCLALTHDNKIYSWGVNDQGALGRDTTWDDDANMKDIDDNKDDSDSDSDDDDNNGLNPLESTPAPISAEFFPEGTNFVDIAAGDSISLALTDTGLVYGWGTFRRNEGILGFSETIQVQDRPILIPELSKITQIACGANHALAIDKTGKVKAWGSGQQNQLGRRMTERGLITGLTPTNVSFKDGRRNQAIRDVACGQYHSLAIGVDGRVWAFGANNFGECGIPESAGKDNAIVETPELVTSLGNNVVSLSGGSHHNVAVTNQGECLVWGRLDGQQIGQPVADVPQSSILNDTTGHPKILIVPTAVPTINNIVAATCGSDHSIAINGTGQAYSWGFSANYQTGLGKDEDVEVATLIDNTAVKGKPLNWAGAGGQFSVLTAIAQ
ncbi:RCC1/BLIP-II [Lophium mytilinum]|uniref:RCC1/BLIP-II n=1 Tax=Lophium mytilinum TaxID=390894 RepID=A0A6A6RAH2_9PEZI|nr:RCC1/BLIP-II [Lophium mytilinum]